MNLIRLLCELKIKSGLKTKSKMVNTTFYHKKNIIKLITQEQPRVIRILQIQYMNILTTYTL